MFCIVVKLQQSARLQQLCFISCWYTVVLLLCTVHGDRSCLAFRLMGIARRTGTSCRSRYDIAGRKSPARRRL